MLEEQSRALQLHRDFRLLEADFQAAANRMPKDQRSFFRSTTSEEVRQATLGPYWRRMADIKREGDLLGVRYASFGSGPYEQGANNIYLFFDAPEDGSATALGLGPWQGWTRYRATTKSQRLLAEQEKTVGRWAKLEKRVATAIRRRVREERREAKKAEREQAQQERKRREQERQEQLRAAVAANAEEVRRQADRLRSRLSGQRHCPYCGQQLGDAVHVDHVYPVSKGGRSVGKNLVKTCVDCNQKKGDRTLLQFIRDCGLDREEIERRLLDLGKEF
jgi:5-methylcytosine-specific restriction endonuclease McrA